MASASILRKSAASLGPLASRAARFHRNYSAPVSAALNRAFLSQKPPQSSFPRSYDFSTAVAVKKTPSDASLLQIIQLEIQCAEESEDNAPLDHVPSGFPFKIEDQPGLQTITLTREYHGETIKVEVHMPNLITGEESDETDDGEEPKNHQSSVPLSVTISKKDGPTLEFHVMAFPEEISIDSMSITNPEFEDGAGYEGPDFSDLDENLQKAFHKYLEMRGIKPNTTNFLHEYMVNKDSREYLMWLNNLKKFVEA